MARDKGTYNMPGNIELRKEAPLDARRKVNTFDELFLEDTWKDSNNRVWLYDGMTVEVGDRLGELWQLKSKTSYNNPEDWIRISGGIEDAPKDGTPYMRQDGKWKGYTQIEEVYTFTPSATDDKVTQEDYDGLKAAIEAGKVIVYSMAVYTQYFISNSSTITDGTIAISFNVDYSCVVISIGSDLTYSETSKTLITKDNTDVYSVTNDYNPAHKKYVDDTNFGKVINGAIEILNNCNLTGTEAETKIITLFGSVSNFKQCVAEMTNNHTRYFYHIDKYCSELIGTAYVNGTKYTLNSIITGYGSNSHLNKRISIVYDTNNKQVIIQNISTDDKLKTMFADITQSPEQNLNDIVGNGIMTNTQNGFATTERNYPINEAGALFYGATAYGRANQIYGGFSSNRWFARGGGDNNYTAWREFAFKDDVYTEYITNGSMNDIITAGEYVISPNVTDKPFGYHCWLKVMGLSDIVQILIDYSDLKIVIRSRINGNWANWKYVTTSDNLSTITKVTTAQYNASSKNANTAYFVTD